MGNYLVSIFITLIFIIGAVYTDIHSDKIWNLWIAVGLGIGVLRQLLLGFPLGKSWIFGLALPVLLFGLVFYIGGIGAGDIKLWILIGGMHGGRIVVRVMIASLLIGALIGLIQFGRYKQWHFAYEDIRDYFKEMILQHKLLKYPGSSIPERRVHFSVAILLGYVWVQGVVIYHIITLLY